MSATIKKLKELFNVEMITPDPTIEEQEFLNRRAEIADNVSFNLSIKEFLIHKDLFKEYGLIGEMLKRIEGEIWYRSLYEPDQFRNSKFYSLFKDHRVVKKHFDESRINKD
jgi:hypothetical protein